MLYLTFPVDDEKQKKIGLFKGTLKFILDIMEKFKIFREPQA